MQALVAAWRNGSMPACLDDLRRQAHQLAGSAGTFGFAALAEAAASLEAAAECQDPPLASIEPLLGELAFRASRLAPT